MSLQGTLDTFSLAEILGLIERSRTTGALEVRDPASRGVLYFAGGRFSAAEAGELTGPVASPDELDARLIDVCFALFRLENAAFVFESDRFPPWPVRGGSEITPIVQQVQQIQRDWLAIEAVIPSLDSVPRLVADLSGDRIVLDKMGFRILRAVDGGRNVREIAREIGGSVLDVCRVLKDLVDSGAIEVASAPTATVVDELVLPGGPASSELEDLTVVVPTAADAARDGIVLAGGTEPPGDEDERQAPEPPAPDAPQPAAAGPGPERDDAPAEPPPRPDRGALLRLFSALRDD